MDNVEEHYMRGLLGVKPLQEAQSTIEFVLRNADSIRKCVEEKRKDAGVGHDDNVGGSRGNKISDPTAQLALQRVAPIDFIHCPYGPIVNGKRDMRYIWLPEKWLIVENNTRRFYTSSDNDKIVKLYTRRYLQGGYGELWQRTCCDLNISRSWYYTVVHDIIRFAEIYASGMGLIIPYSRF